MNFNSRCIICLRIFYIKQSFRNLGDQRMGPGQYVFVCCLHFQLEHAANGDTPTLTSLSVIGSYLCLCSLGLVS